ncbi:MAG: exported protein of unknown function [Parcubacteria group bacterium]|nr:exported protein of unknown function [Parcubacteria group bacterium]
MKKFFHLSLITLALFGFSHPARALTISPARLELSGDPGETISGEFLLINEQEDTKTFYSSAENFEAQGETGTPTFVSSQEGLASWIKVDPEVTLSKAAQHKVSFSITIPKDADAGGHFAAIFLGTTPPKDKGQVSVGAKVGVLILLRVSGDIKEGGGITGFSTENNKTFFTSLPVRFVYRFNNSGNDRVNPTGTVVIRDTVFLTAAKLDANSREGNVLPGSTRRFDVVWGEEQETEHSGFFGSAAYELKHFAFGMYAAHLNIEYGANGTAEASKIIFVFPWQLLIITLAVLALLLFVLSRLLKRYNRWIIRKAQGTLQ